MHNQNQVHVTLTFQDATGATMRTAVVLPADVANVLEHSEPQRVVRVEREEQ